MNPASKFLSGSVVVFGQSKFACSMRTCVRALHFVAEPEHVSLLCCSAARFRPQPLHLSSGTASSRFQSQNQNLHLTVPPLYVLICALVDWDRFRVKHNCWCPVGEELEQPFSTLILGRHKWEPFLLTRSCFSLAVQGHFQAAHN